MPPRESVKKVPENNNAKQQVLNENFEQKNVRQKNINLIGASVLTLVNFQNGKGIKGIVQHYFEKQNRIIKHKQALARQEYKNTGKKVDKIEQIPGKNQQEKRNYAYIDRLDQSITRYGNRIERRLWDETIKQVDSFINWENMTSASWKHLESEFHE